MSAICDALNHYVALMFYYLIFNIIQKASINTRKLFAANLLIVMNGYNLRHKYALFQFEIIQIISSHAHS